MVDLGDSAVCRDCARNYTRCSDCDGWFRDSDLTDVNYNAYCSDCLSKMKVTENA
jgi:hypothetical protein